MNRQRTVALFLGISLMVSALFAEHPRVKQQERLHKSTVETNPIFNRARGYLDQGKIQTAIVNYGNFIDLDHSPAGLWDKFQYIANASLVVGAPGRIDLRNREWTDLGNGVYLTQHLGDVKYLYLDCDPQDADVFCTPEARQQSQNDLTAEGDWYYNSQTNELSVFLGSRTPANAPLFVEMAWAYRTKYTPGNEVSTDTVYWGGTTQESWFDRSTNTSKTDWEAIRGAKNKTHSGKVTAGDIYGDIYTQSDDTYPLLATSTLKETWPITGYDEDTGDAIHKWPGWWAVETDPSSPDYLKEIPGRFVSDTDVYMEFDDRYSNRDIDPNQGYPLGVKVLATAHSYGRNYAEDIAFFTMKLVNVSDRIVLPDETVGLNGGKGYDYSGLSVGFYYDVDAYSALENGSSVGRTNDDDMMGYLSEYDIAYIYDLDDESGGYTDLAYTGIKLLDSPNSSDYLDTDADGTDDIAPGDPLGMTDWHWFDWYVRPGVESAETNSGPFAGDGETKVASFKEMIQYKLMRGDTSNLPAITGEWYFHPNPDGLVNPHYDSMEGLMTDYPDGLDCVFIMSSGPFDFAVGDTINFSFCVLAGQGENDMVKNADIAQIMYDLHYQGFSPPATPEVSVVPDDQQVTLYWDNAAETSTDIVTGYSDFEGYKVYKSTDGGLTWGDSETDIIYDNNGVSVGWEPLAQFDLTEDEDIARYGRQISGSDPMEPWINLGDNTGLQHSFVDTDVENGVEYTYAVTSYDIGIEPPYTIEWNEVYITDNNGDTTDVYWEPDTIESANNPDGWFGLASLETPRGNNENAPNFIKVTPAARPSNVQGEIQFVANETNFGNGVFGFEVLDLNDLTGHSYRIEMSADKTPGEFGYIDTIRYENPRFTVLDMTSGDTLIKDSEKINYFSGGTEDYSDIFDGIRLNISNYHPANSNLGEVGYVYEAKWDPEPIVTEGRLTMDTVRVDFTASRPWFYDYEFTFGAMGTSQSASRGTYPGGIELPFTVHNMQTGNPVSILTKDVGADGNPETDDVGQGDGQWTPGEIIKFWEKGVNYTDTSRTEITYDVFFRNINNHDEIDWTNYESLSVVTKKPFFDGDFWEFSTEDLVEQKQVTKNMLKDIKVVPNPYVVSAYWEQVQYEKKILFTHLPAKCTINIFTVVGDRVATIQHNDAFDGSAAWNLQTYNRQEVAPGLYVYTVEAGGKKKVGKFAIIR